MNQDSKPNLYSRLFHNELKDFLGLIRLIFSLDSMVATEPPK